MRCWLLVGLFALASCADEKCDVGQTEACNVAPIADAGGDLSVPYQSFVKLDGSASHDPDSSTIVYHWELTDVPSGSTATLDDEAAARPSFFTDRQGTYVARLIVGDGLKWSLPTNVAATAVKTGNTSPIADAGQNAIVILGSPYVLNGSGSFDPDGDPLSFAWAITSSPGGSATVLANANTVAPTFTPDQDGTYTIRLVVSDGALTSTPSTVTIETGPIPNASPVANAGQNATATTGQVVFLNGTASFDPDGSPLSYSWAITTRPPGSSAQLQSPNWSVPSLRPDVDGVYEIMLVVSDGVFTSTPDTVTITSSTPPNRAPVANAGLDAAVGMDQVLVLDGAGSSDPDGDALSFAWTITSRPGGSTTMLASASTPTPTFTPDVIGTYQLSLVVDDGDLTSADTVAIIVIAPTTSLAYRALDAEYSSALDRIIMVTAAPNTLQIFDPVAGTSVTVALPTTPTSVSVSPDGLRAAVGHDGWVSIVDLQTAAVTVTHPASAKAVDVVLAGNGYVYVFPTSSQWQQIRCVNIATGIETLGTGLIYAGMKAKLHPSGMFMYGATNGLSPSDIEKHALGSGVATRAYDSPYHGDYPMCGNLWMTEDGLRIVTACGNVFRASSVMSEDMTYNGALAGAPGVVHAVHAPTPSKLLVIPGQSDRLRIYDYPFLNFEQQFVLPKFFVMSNRFNGFGRFVFSNSAGTRYYVVLRPDATSGLPDDGVATFSF